MLGGLPSGPGQGGVPRKRDRSSRKAAGQLQSRQRRDREGLPGGVEPPGAECRPTHGQQTREPLARQGGQGNLGRLGQSPGGKGDLHGLVAEIQRKARAIRSLGIGQGCEPGIHHGLDSRHGEASAAPDRGEAIPGDLDPVLREGRGQGRFAPGIEALALATFYGGGAQPVRQQESLEVVVGLHQEGSLSVNLDVGPRRDRGFNGPSVLVSPESSGSFGPLTAPAAAKESPAEPRPSPLPHSPGWYRPPALRPPAAGPPPGTRDGSCRAWCRTPG